MFMSGVFSAWFYTINNSLCIAFLHSANSAVHYDIWRDDFAQIELGVEIENLGVE